MASWSEGVRISFWASLTLECLAEFHRWEVPRRAGGDLPSS